MTIKEKAIEAAIAPLIDSSLPFRHRRHALLQLCADDNPLSLKILERILEAAARGDAESLLAKKAEELSQLLEELRGGPLRRGTFLGVAPTNGSSVRRARVLLETGESAYPVIADEDLARGLVSGASVLLDAQARCVLHPDVEEPPVGEEAKLERQLDESRVEVLLRDHEPLVLRVAAGLAAKLQRGEVAPGARLLVCSRRRLAFDAVPPADGLAHYQFLCREPVPDVVLERDVGDPPRFIAELLEHVRTEMETPHLGRKYRLRRATTKLLCGVSGAGKSHGIRAFWRLLYEAMAEHVGVPLEDLPPRVFKLRMPQVLSKWLGASDKNLDRFFDEIEQLAGVPFLGPDGRSHELPVLVICEEIDGLARARGGDQVYDRIQTTALERLDVNCQRLGSRLIIFIFTTNVSHLVDPAFLRRAGGTIERYSRLGRRGFEAVLAKHLRGLPLRADIGPDAARAERRVLRELSDWLFSKNGHDPGQVQLTYVGSATPVLKHRRDFLTPALIDRAVQQGASAACSAERHGAREPGISIELLQDAFACQVQAIVDSLTVHNAAEHVTLPDGARVGDLRRIEQPALGPHHLARRSLETAGNGASRN